MKIKSENFLVSNNEIKKFIYWIQKRHPNCKWTYNKEKLIYNALGYKNFKIIFLVTFIEEDQISYFDWYIFTDHQHKSVNINMLTLNLLNWKTILRKEKINNLLK